MLFLNRLSFFDQEFERFVTLSHQWVVQLAELGELLLGLLSGLQIANSGRADAHFGIFSGLVDCVVHYK